MRHLKGQAAYDSQAPPDDLCPACGYESSCDCICDDIDDDADYQCPDCGAGVVWCGDGWMCNETCGWHSTPLITAADMAEAADELATERLEEIIEGGEK